MKHRVHLVIGLIPFWSSLLFAQLHGTTMGPCNNDDDCSTIPHIVYSPAPGYSDQARKAKREGTCTLTLVVGVDGHTSDVKVVSGLGMGLDEKAIEAVKRWAFEPAIRKAKPVPVKIAIEIVLTAKARAKPQCPALRLTDLIKC